jgi:hypothetical protein
MIYIQLICAVIIVDMQLQLLYIVDQYAYTYMQLLYIV